MCNRLCKRNQTEIGENETTLNNIKVKKLNPGTPSGHVSCTNSTNLNFLTFCKENILEGEPIHTFDNSSQIGKFSN